jgi:hypothetical protein
VNERESEQKVRLSPGFLLDPEHALLAEYLDQLGA